MKKYIYILFLLCSFFGKSQLSESALKALFDEQLTAVLASSYVNTNPLSASNTNGALQQHYYMSWMLDAVIRAWQATGDIVYFNHAKTWLDNVMGNSITLSTGGAIGYEGYPMDPSMAGPALYFETDGAELFEVYWVRHAAHLLWVLENSPNFVATNNLSSWKTSTLNWIEINFWEKWWQNSNAVPANRWIYRDYIQIASMGMVTAAYLDKLTNNSGFDYRTVWQNFAYNGIPGYSNATNDIREALIANTSVSTAYRWTKWLDGDAFEIDDTSHASDTVNALVSMYDLTLHFDIDDMNALTSTFRDVIMKNVIEYQYSQYIDGTGATLSQESVAMNGWHLLGRFDPAFQVLLENNLDENDDSQPDGALLLYNRRLLNGNPLYYPESNQEPPVIITNSSIMPLLINSH